MLVFLLGISLTFNIVFIILFRIIYVKVIKRNPLSHLKNIDKEFWNL